MYGNKKYTVNSMSVDWHQLQSASITLQNTCRSCNKLQESRRTVLCWQVLQIRDQFHSHYWVFNSQAQLQMSGQYVSFTFHKKFLGSLLAKNNQKTRSLKTQISTADTNRFACNYWKSHHASCWACAFRGTTQQRLGLMMMLLNIAGTEPIFL